MWTCDGTALVGQITGEDPWRPRPRTAMTLHKAPGFQVVLIAMHVNTTMASHHADGPRSVQSLEGRLICRPEGHDVRLSPRPWLLLHTGMLHAIEASEDAAFVCIMGTGAAEAG